MSRTKRDIIDTTAMLQRLAGVLMAHSSTTQAEQCIADAESLRRISMTLHRWHEMECNGEIERSEASGRPYFCYEQNGHRRQSDSPIPDREKGALARLAAIMARYPALTSYVQGDPRGCTLYVLRPGDVPEGEKAESYYSCGLAVHQ